jgi:hypothetical protein
MNVVDNMHYGHQAVLGAIHNLPASKWDVSGVCGDWSVKDIMAHLASFERVLTEVLASLLEKDIPTPTLDRFQQDFGNFNDREVARRQRMTPAEVLSEYKANHARVQAIAKQIPAETFRRAGVLPWYGAEYDVEDFLVYTFYAHKREHAAQIEVYRDKLSRALPYWLEGNVVQIAVA